ncbi:GNAT family N-acetyltransferase [Aspergillus undulatus]|uniref:GNAT family N-acetyltransferase n=1 Tax=Aspergillus undulatus TaxID=1810928 RepID=UPI003CCCEC31
MSDTSPGASSSTTTTPPETTTAVQPVAVILPEPADMKPIQTERLILRPVDINSDSEARALFRIRSREDVARWLYALDPEPDRTIEETKAWMRGRILTTPDVSGAVHSRHFFFTIGPIMPKTDPEIIGAVGVNSLYDAPSVGIALHPAHWGKGYGTEAMRGLIGAWWRLARVEMDGDGDGGQAERLYAMTSNENVPSFKLLHKVGFRVQASDEGEGGNVVLMSMVREWFKE